MDSKHQDIIFHYKKLEDEINKSIHDRTNCRFFTIAFGKGMDAHLSQLKVHRRLTTKWLNRIDLPNKDEIAAISIRVVDCEEKLDILDETLYTITKRMQENSHNVKRVKRAFEDLLVTLKEEVKEMQDYKIKRLEEELFELKQLFHTEFE